MGVVVTCIVRLFPDALTRTRDDRNSFIRYRSAEEGTRIDRTCGCCRGKDEGDPKHYSAGTVPHRYEHSLLVLGGKTIRY